MFEQVEQQGRSPVVTVATQAAADLLVATLRVNGVEAMTIMASAIPSIDWLEGFAVLVPELDADPARHLLRELGHEPLAPSD